MSPGTEVDEQRSFDAAPRLVTIEAVCARRSRRVSTNLTADPLHSPRRYSITVLVNHLSFGSFTRFV